MVRSDYKVGEWLIHRQSKQLCKIIQIIEFTDGDHNIVVEYLNTNYYTEKVRPVSKINKLYAKAKSAQLLYSTNIQRR